MEFLKRILSKLGKSKLGEKAGQAGQKLLGTGEEGLVTQSQLLPRRSKEEMRKMALKMLGGTAAGGALVGSGATYAGMKDFDEEDEEEMPQKGKNKARKWMD